MNEAELQGIRAEAEFKATIEHVEKLLSEIYRLKAIIRMLKGDNESTK